MGGQVVVISVIIGSLFANLPHVGNDARSYFGISFLSIMFLSMGAMPELGLTFQHKPCVLPASLAFALMVGAWACIYSEEHLGTFWHGTTGTSSNGAPSQQGVCRQCMHGREASSMSPARMHVHAGCCSSSATTASSRRPRTP